MNLQLSQVLLILALVFFSVYVFHLRTVVLERSIYFILAFGGTVFILYPAWSTRLANYIGIGRGADLILYTFIIFSLFHYVHIASRFKQLEHQMTAVVRSLAITEAMRDRPSHEGNVEAG